MSDINLAPDREPVDIEKLNYRVKKIGELKAQKARIAEWAKARAAGLDSAIAWEEDRVKAEALYIHGQTGSSTIPLTAGELTVKAAGPRETKDALALGVWLLNQGLSSDPEWCSLNWKMSKLKENVEWAKPDDQGIATAHFKPTGEEIPGLVRYHPKGEYTVTIKPGEIVPVEEE